MNFQYSGVLSDPFSIKCIIALIFAVALYAYIISLIIKKVIQDKKDKKSFLNAGVWAILVYLAVILAAWIISIKTEILYSRYLLVITGFLAFGLAYF